MGKKRPKDSPDVLYNKKYKQRNQSSTDSIQELSESESDSEGTEFFETFDSDTDATPKMKFSKQDLTELSTLLAPLLIKEIKLALKDEIKNKVKTAIKEISKDLHSEIEGLKSEITNLKSDLNSSRAELDELAQYGRRMNLDITCIVGDSGDPDEDVETKVLNLAISKDINIKRSDIDKCHRKGKHRSDKKGNRRVIVKFTNSKARNLLYNSRKELGQGIFIQDNLTPFRESLAYHARQLKRDKLITKTWVSGWRVFVLLPGETNGRHVTSMDVIQTIKERSPV